MASATVVCYGCGPSQQPARAIPFLICRRLRSRIVHEFICSTSRRKPAHSQCIVVPHAVSGAGGKMKKHSILVALFALLLGMCAAPLWAQVGIREGYRQGPDGKPIDGATVELVNSDTGGRIDLKTNAKGEFLSLGVAPRHLQRHSAQGRQGMDKFDKVPINAGDERELLISTFPRRRAPGATEEQKKQIEDAQKQNEKIKDSECLLWRRPNSLKPPGSMTRRSPSCSRRRRSIPTRTWCGRSGRCAARRQEVYGRHRVLSEGAGN